MRVNSGDEDLRRLAASIITIAVEDWQKVAGTDESIYLPDNDGVEVSEQELLEFFASTWFDLLMEVLNIEADKFLYKIVKPAKMKPYWRKRYGSKR